MTYGIVGGMGGGGSMSLNTHMTTGMGMAAYDGSPMRTSAPEMGSPNASASNANSTGSTGGAGTQHDQSAAFNLCRRRVVAPGIEGQSSMFAASIDPELAGIAVRVVNPQPLLLPNGFLWEFECLETYPGWEEKRAEWIAERAELHTWHGRIPDVAGSHISSSNRTGKLSAVWVCKSEFPDLSQRSEREVLVIARSAIQGGSVDWAQMVCRRAMPPARTLLPHGESQLKMWILRALSILLLQGVEVVEWSYEFLVTEQQFWWIYRGQSSSGGVPDLSELDRGEPIPDSI
ncbi:hypothetical protein RhiJN_18942 [Ceratobasidium sp. AG-Ba]|nr:hypothetical protein RhiJN_18942 [Ceratobasidium sp. AG-Ba]